MSEAPSADSTAVLDRALYALFARHADDARQTLNRRRYRGTDLRISFDVYLARVYGCSWGVFLATFVLLFTVLIALPVGVFDAATQGIDTAIPTVVPRASREVLAFGAALLGASTGKYTTVLVGGLYLEWCASARRTNIEQTLPGAVRYLHALSSGSDDHRAMLRKVADNDAYGETAVSLRKALNTAVLTGSLSDGLRQVARDTPSRNLLAPFVLKFHEHATQGPDTLANYLRMEGRMLAHQQDRARQRAEGYLELLAESFIVLLVLPALLVIVLTVMSVLAPGLSAPVPIPLVDVTMRAVITYGSAAFVLLVGLTASLLVASLRPPGQTVTYARPDDVLALLVGASRNPASAAVICLAPAILVGGILVGIGVHPVNVVLLGYVAYALPVGLVAIRRARHDDAKDREIADFVHAVSGHVSLGRPFPRAVELVARDIDLGPLNPDVADLAFNLQLTTGDPATDPELRTAALSRFVDRVGTPLAEQTIGLVTGALDAGSDTETVFETLQTEIGQLYHQKRALRSNLLVYVAVGWTTALLVIGITVAVNQYVLDGFAQLSSLSGSSGFALNPQAIQPERDRFRFYVVTQSTMLASGWFAGTASRGVYEALLHSAGLVTACYLVFFGVGMA